jgi:hypothetical protein
MSAPTEAEIHAVIGDRLTRYPADMPDRKIRAGIEEMADFMYGPARDRLDGERSRGDRWREWPEDLWDDLRHPEAARLDQLYREATDRALARCLEIATEEIVAAAETFAREYPDAPRAQAATVAA